MTHRVLWFWIIAATMIQMGLGRDAFADEVPGLYEGRVVVTGQGEANRATAMVECFREVLAKTSGDLRLLRRPATAALAATARSAMRSYDYHDRMAGLPLHDEEGTRRRPYDLTIRFDPNSVAVALSAMGSRLWSSPRQHLVAFVDVKRAETAFLLSLDGGEAASGHREAFRDAAWQTGVPASLPRDGDLARAGIDADTVATLPLAKLDQVARDVAGGVPLQGTLTWSDTAIAWLGEWHLLYRGRSFDWQTRDESFDGAYRDTLRGAAFALSGLAVRPHLVLALGHPHQ